MNHRRADIDSHAHHGLPESRLPDHGLIRSTVWTDIKLAHSPDKRIAAQAKRRIGEYYYNSIRRVFRSLTREQSPGDTIAVDLTHDFLVAKIWTDDASPLLNNIEKLEKMKSEEDAGQAWGAFRAYLHTSLKRYVYASARKYKHFSLDSGDPDDDGIAARLEGKAYDDQNFDEWIRTGWAEELLSQAIANLEEIDRVLVQVKLSDESWETYARRTGKSGPAIRKRWSRHTMPNLRIRIDNILERERPAKGDRDAELRECLRLADRKNQLKELVSLDSND